MMKATTVLCILSLLGIGACCDLGQSETVPQNKLLGSWYEVDSYGDSMTAIFNKCIKNDISLSGSSTIKKNRSYLWKLFPFITWHEKSTLTFKGVVWELETSTWFGSKTTGLSIIKQDPTFLILKSCPDAWFTEERIWVYAKNKDLTVDQIAAINKALSDKKEPSFGSFRSITQSC